MTDGRNDTMRNMWKDAVLGVVTGDALGLPVQFESREETRQHPITGMRGNGTFRMPPGTWTDDSSLTLALLDSIREKNAIDLNHIMDNFVQWLYHNEFTPFNEAFDIGQGTMQAIRVYRLLRDPARCGGAEVWNNGNGSLMRIMPACLYCCAKGLDDENAVQLVHQISALTHAHIRAKIACGLYYFMVRALLREEGSLSQRLQKGLDRGFAWYDASLVDKKEVAFYDRLRDLSAFAQTPEEEISSKGYVVASLEAAVWSLLGSDTFESALLKAVNLGWDSDTVGAIAGGLAGLYYGCGAIPEDWLAALQRRAWIEEMCDAAQAAVQ